MKKFWATPFLWSLLVVVHAQTPEIPFALISQVREAGPKVVAVSIDFGKTLPIQWKLAQAFSVQAELHPVKNYAGEVIANSASAKAPRTLLRAYTSAQPEIGQPSQGRYVILEMDPDDGNAASWYPGFNPGIRQMIPYQDNMRYEVKLLQDLNVLAANVHPNQPAATVEMVKAGANFKQSASRMPTVEKFTQDVFRQPGNPQTRFLAYNLHRPAHVPPQAKVPLVVFLHGSGQSHDYVHFANAEAADVLSPLLANQGGVSWVERAPEQAYVLVPQAPARDTKDPAGESGWRGADTQKLLFGLIDQLMAQHPDIDPRRLYLTGLSMGAMGSWKILTDPNPQVSQKFAAAALFNGIPTGSLSALPGEARPQQDARILNAVKSVPYQNLAVPIWITHADTDPVVPRIGARVPFALISGKGETDADGELMPAKESLKQATPLVRRYESLSAAHKKEIRYTEYLFGNGDRFLDLGMVTRHGHFSWEISYKDPEIMDWMFAQRKP